MQSVVVRNRAGTKSRVVKLSMAFDAQFYQRK